MPVTSTETSYHDSQFVKSAVVSTSTIKLADVWVGLYKENILCQLSLFLYRGMPTQLFDWLVIRWMVNDDHSVWHCASTPTAECFICILSYGIIIYHHMRHFAKFTSFKDHSVDFWMLEYLLSRNAIKLSVSSFILWKLDILLFIVFHGAVAHRQTVDL